MSRTTMDVIVVDDTCYDNNGIETMCMKQRKDIRNLIDRLKCEYQNKYMCDMEISNISEEFSVVHIIIFKKNSSLKNFIR